MPAPFRPLGSAVLVALLVLGGTAGAEERRVPTSPSDLKLSFAPVVQHVSPSVVNVYAAKVVENHNPLLDDPFFRRFFGGPNSGMPR